MKSKSLKIYLALFALTFAFNGILAAKLRLEKTSADPTSPTDLTTVTVAPPSGDAAAVSANPFGLPSVPTESEELSYTESVESRHGRRRTKKKLEYTKLSEKLCFSDLGVNSEGIIVGIGLDNELYEYAFAEEHFVALKTDYEISNMWRVDINYDGIIYVVTRCGDTYYLDCERRWNRLPGCAIDIGAGRGGEIYKIGCEDFKHCEHRRVVGEEPTVTKDERGIEHRFKPSSPDVYKLICSCNCKCCERRCKVFIKKYHYLTCEPAERRVCYWIKLPPLRHHGRLVRFTRIDAKFTGHPIVTDGDRSVYEFFGGDENKFKLIYKAPRYFTDINDIASDNDGNDFFCTDRACYIIDGPNDADRIRDHKGKWKSATDVSVGPYGMISFIHDKHMYTVAKVGFN